MTADLHFKDICVCAEELEERARRLGGGLIARGIRAGDVIAVLARNHPVYADVIMACRLLGCHYCPINSHLTEAEIGFILADSESKLVIAQDDLLEQRPAIRRSGLPILIVDPSPAHSADSYEAWLARQQLFSGSSTTPGSHMPYTAGTTGTPKGVIRRPVPVEEQTKRRLLYETLMSEAFGVRRGGRLLMPAPLYHSAPSVIAQTSLSISERFVLMPRFDASELLELVERHRIETLYLVPIMYTRLLALPAQVRNAFDLTSLRFIASTGAPCAPEVKRAMIDWLGPIVHETYASSEVGAITVINAEEALRRPGSAGRPLDSAVVRIFDDEGKAVPPRTTGLIYVRQSAYPDFTYRGNSEARQLIEREGLVTLGDMGFLDEEGYLYVNDRAADMVVSGGVNIYPAEIEHQLVTYPGVVDCAVFGIPDHEYGERLMAILQVNPGISIDSGAVIDWLRTRIAGFKIPRVIETAATLPRDENGKIAKRRLRAPYWADHDRKI